MAKKVLKWARIVLGVVLLAVVGLAAWLTVTEYKPDPVEDVELFNNEVKAEPLAPGSSLTVLSQNTGYAGLGADSDFFMDGGKDVAPTREQTDVNLNGLAAQLAE